MKRILLLVVFVSGCASVPIPIIGHCKKIDVIFDYKKESENRYWEIYECRKK